MRVDLKRGRYVLIARQGIAAVRHEALTKELSRLFAKAGLFREENQR